LFSAVVQSATLPTSSELRSTLSDRSRAKYLGFQWFPASTAKAAQYSSKAFELPAANLSKASLRRSLYPPSAEAPGLMPMTAVPPERYSCPTANGWGNEIPARRSGSCSKQLLQLTD
jgi:hypothetical protein